ncbi:MAG TPA: tripartite tricarboxylate transporter TctB family protein [Sphaerochaeta sp.]|jgi:hypothetical protein|nr:tripartite tricarboxylate transporter TctB family protein [Sphaerochaeta sp.]HQB05861.1 tripartite tricarboxylate transporter TctB family protein [Sphaerochaeta sp.]
MTEKKTSKMISIVLDKMAFPLFMFVTGVIAVFESIRLTEKYVDGDWLSGPSSFMMILGLIILAICFIETVKSVFQIRSDLKKLNDTVATRENEEKSDEEKGYIKDMIISFAMVLVYIFIIRYTGFALATVIYLAANLMLLKNPVLRVVLTVVVILALLLWGAPAMGISLPRGFLGF